MATSNKGGVELVKVTPEMAAEWLLHNTHNRKLRERTVKAYAADITAGAWVWNGESIKFSAHGVLLDGQHRLAAIVEAGQPVEMLVVRDLPDATQETMDGGVKRKFQDVLNLRGEASSSALAAITRRVYNWELGSRKSWNNIAPTNAQLLHVLEQHPELRDITTAAINVARTCGIQGSIIGLGMFIFGRIDTDDTDFFFSRLADGQNLASGDPIYELRRTAEQSRSVRGERSAVYITAIMIKAWNAYRAGDKISILRYRPGGANPDKFPEPR